MNSFFYSLKYLLGTCDVDQSRQWGLAVNKKSLLSLIRKRQKIDEETNTSFGVVPNSLKGQ